MLKAASFFLFAALAAGATQAQGTGGLKPGLWESRTTKMQLNGQDMLKQMAAVQAQMRQSLAAMPPEQRKKMEGMLAQQGGDGMTQRLCVSAEMAAREQAVVPRPAQAECEPPKFQRNGHRTSFEVSCKQAGGGTARVKGESVVTGDTVSTKAETRGTDPGGAPHTMLVETQMKYLGSDCGQVKPVEQLVRELSEGAAAPRPAPARK